MYQKFSPNLNTETNYPKPSLPYLAVLFFTLWIIFLSQFSNNIDFTDDTSRVRIENVRGITPDIDASPDSPHGIISHFLVDTFFYVTLFYVITFISISAIPRLLFLAHVRPRSPPL